MRLTIFLLLFSLSAQGQFIINSYRFGAPAPTDLLLDSFPGAAAAYSLRKLDKDYAGDAIVVRRSSNNDTLAIGFSGGVLDTVALKNFCGTGATDSCFVRVWYDQSGNGRHAVQDTAASQPYILIGGSVIRTNTKAAMRFDALFDNLKFSSNFSTFNNTTIFNVTAPSSYSAGAVNARFYDLYDGTDHIQLTRDNASQKLHAKNTLWQPSTNATQFTTQNAPTAQFLSTLLALSSSNDLYFNNSLQSKTSTTNVGSGGTIGVIGQRADLLNSTQFVGNYQELIIYQSDQSANRTAIETNINNFYSIY
jgi:hypothetical protein